MRSIKEVDLDGKRVFIRVDFNVPMDEHQNITDSSRIRAVLSTIKYALDNNAKIIVASHLGRPEGKVVPELSLLPIAKRLAWFIKHEVKMAPDCIGPEVKKMVSDMKPGDVILLENLRFHIEEQNNDDEFAKELADLCDVYINDAFAVSHRENASVVAITKYVHEAAGGFLLQKERAYIRNAIFDPQRPLVAIIGGAKVSSKIGAFKNMLQVVDKFIIGGAMANTFLKSQGCDIGNSKVEDNYLQFARDIMKEAKRQGVKFYLPVDAVAAPEIDLKVETKIVPMQEIPSDWMVLDIGPSTSLLYNEALYDAKTIIWNGPMGVFELDPFSRGTLDMVNHVANSYALTIVGGGDTDVAVHKTGQTDRITYVSTGGGAFLYIMEGRRLPATIALDEAEKRMKSAPSA